MSVVETERLVDIGWIPFSDEEMKGLSPYVRWFQA